MARTKEPKFTIRRVNSKEDRRRPSVFMRLKTDESFKGVALFEPDPEAADNPGYYEYYDHYDKQGNSYVPCAGDKCPFCAANDNPSTRALTVWYFPEAADVKDQVKVFTMNYKTISDISDESEEEDGILGRTVRIKRLSDKGDYKVRVIAGKPLTKRELTALMKDLDEKFPDGLEGLVTKQLIAQMERLKAMDALEEDDDDDDDDDEPTPKGRGKGKKIVEDEEDEDEDDEEDEDEDDEEEEGDEDDEEESEDDDDEESEDEEDEDDEDEDAEGGEVTAEYEVVKVNESDEIYDLKDEDGAKVKMWLGQGVEVDYDEFVKGATAKISAVSDDEGDWVVTEIEVLKPPKATRAPRKTTAPKKTATAKKTTAAKPRTRRPRKT